VKKLVNEGELEKIFAVLPYRRSSTRRQSDEDHLLGLFCNKVEYSDLCVKGYRKVRSWPHFAHFLQRWDYICAARAQSKVVQNGDKPDIMNVLKDPSFPRACFVRKKMKEKDSRRELLNYFSRFDAAHALCLGEQLEKGYFGSVNVILEPLVLQEEELRDRMIIFIQQGYPGVKEYVTENLLMHTPWGRSALDTVLGAALGEGMKDGWSTLSSIASRKLNVLRQCMRGYLMLSSETSYSSDPAVKEYLTQRTSLTPEGQIVYDRFFNSITKPFRDSGENVETIFAYLDDSGFFWRDSKPLTAPPGTDYSGHLVAAHRNALDCLKKLRTRIRKEAQSGPTLAMGEQTLAWKRMEGEAAEGKDARKRLEAVKEALEQETPKGELPSSFKDLGKDDSWETF